MNHKDKNDYAKDQIPPALLSINLKAALSSGKGFFPELIANYLIDNCQDLWKVLLSMSKETTDVEANNEDVWIKGFHAVLFKGSNVMVLFNSKYANLQNICRDRKITKCPS